MNERMYFALRRMLGIILEHLKDKLSPDDLMRFTLDFNTFCEFYGDARDTQKGDRGE